VAVTGDLERACADLAALLPEAGALIAIPDADGTHGGHQPGSKPPWNTQAANAALDAHAGVRDVEHNLRFAAGLPVRRRGGTDANTLAALEVIPSLAAGDVDDGVVARAQRDLERLARPIQELPPIDQAEAWRRIPAKCPYCGHGMMRVAPRAGTVTCLRYGACSDRDGKHPIGHVYVSQLTGDPRIGWNDGTVT
jgi:hypothetical protein